MAAERDNTPALAPVQRNVTIVYNTTLYVVRFRMNLIRRLQQAGFCVIVCSPPDEHVESLTRAGVVHEPIDMSQYGLNALAEMRTLYQLARILIRYRPVASLHFTVKPNTFGNFAAALVGVPTISNIAGAGQAFSDRTPALKWVVRALYRVALRGVGCVFFQNAEDMRLFLSYNLVKPQAIRRIPGSGVDLTSFKPSPLPRDEVRFLFVGRLLKQKGIGEFVDAAKKVLMANPHCRFVIVGELETGSRGIADCDLEYVRRTPAFTYRGMIAPSEMPTVFQDSSCVVLPSYYGEGVPRSLLEACASARPIITTDNVGCRDVVDHDIEGYKVPIRDVGALASAMKKFLELPYDKKQEMGENGRKRAERLFDERIVLDAYMAEVAKIVGMPLGGGCDGCRRI